MKEGQFHVYTGDGKGKTTAAVGLAVRAAGAGLSVYIGQFIKDMEYHELHILKTIPQITTELYGTGNGCLIGKQPSLQDIHAAQKGYEKALDILKGGKFDVVILDEINVAYQLGVLQEEALLNLVNQRSYNVELIFTGRGCPQSVIEQADLVTQMQEIKHYYQTKHLLSRKGIEY